MFYNQQQRNNHWLYPPIPNHCRMFLKQNKNYTLPICFLKVALNRRASDSGANLFPFHHQTDVTHSNTINSVQPPPLPHIPSSISNVKKNKNIFKTKINFVILAIIPRKYYTWCSNNLTNIFNYTT